ncbi:MAG: alpha/beta hydrolase [Ruminiclostridium sp.]|nr:alpha/beta hydrolase [Ruminiclostridium sp.]
MTTANREVNIYPATKVGSPLVVFNAFENEGTAVHAELEKLKTADFTLATININDWNADLSPWEIPPVYKNDEPFTGGADAYLETLNEEIIPAIIAEVGSEPAYVALAGYSLAGLFAVYAMYKTDRFARIASASGSMWFPGFVEFAKSHEPAALPQKLYLSLGDREARTRNQIMATVEQNTGALYDHYKSLGVEAVFEMNPGNHFQDAAQRMAKGIAWLVTS